MNKNIKQLMESLFDEETDNMLASDKDSINNTFAEKITGITIGKDHIIYEAVDLDLPSGNLWCDRNIGATKPTKTGGYFRRNGFTLDKISLDSAAGINWDSYIKLLYSRLKNETIKYKSVPEFILGHGWDIPSKNDIEELINNTNVSQIQVGKNGITFKVSSLKFTLVIVVKSPSITIRSVASVFALFSQAWASPMRAPVSSSCKAAVAAVFPQTPAFPTHPVHPAVCSH